MKRTRFDRAMRVEGSPRSPDAVAVPRGERGSAYLVALMALVVLTILGLSLVLITQTEVQVGANERTVNRTFYTADSGFHVMTAEALANDNYVAPMVTLNETKVGTLGQVSTFTKTSPFTPITANSLDSHICPYCPANEAGTKYYTKTYQLTSGGSPTNSASAPIGTGLGEKQLSLTMVIQPAKDPPTNAIKDPTLLQNVKF